MRYKKIIIAAGTRPNFVKAAPLLRAFKALPKAKRPKVLLLHTGQHYDYLMSKVFFEDLEIPQPDIFLNVKAQTPAGQTGEIIDKFRKVLAVQKPGLVMVVGDVTGTLACALAAKMSGIAVAHVEAGLRSYDNTMPEERNRVLTDHVSDLLFTSCPEAEGNLLKEGIARKKIFFAGNVMIDSLKAEILKAEGRINLTTKAELLKAEGRINLTTKAESLKAEGRNTKGRRQNKLQYEGGKTLRRLGLEEGGRIMPYVLLTLHRPGNVDDPKVLSPILKAFEQIAKEVAVVFPAHPRTLERLGTNAKFKLQIADIKSQKTGNEISNSSKTRGKSTIQSTVFSLPVRGLQIVPPLGYLDFISLQSRAVCVFTDSGGVQEETSFMGVPCFTVRNNTERPVTVRLGTNQIIGIKPGAILKAWNECKMQIAKGRNQKKEIGNRKSPNCKSGIPKWDGKAAERIVKTIINVQ